MFFEVLPCFLASQDPLSSSGIFHTPAPASATAPRGHGEVLNKYGPLDLHSGVGAGEGAPSEPPRLRNPVHKKLLITLMTSHQALLPHEWAA